MTARLCSRRQHGSTRSLIFFVPRDGYRQGLREKRRWYVASSGKLPPLLGARIAGLHLQPLESSFSDEKLASGLAEMQKSYAEWPALEFVDHFDFILGIRE